MSRGDIIRGDAILWAVTYEQAADWMERIQQGEAEDAKYELSKMEWLARLLGSNWRAPKIGKCNEQDKEACRQKYGESLDFACQGCSRK